MRPIACVIAAVLLAGCTTTAVPEGQLSPLARYVPSPNQSWRRPQLIVLHYTAIDTLEESRRTLSDPDSPKPVSSHYLIDRDGTILQLVPDHRRARHAGLGRWGDIRDVNDVSAGIEIVNNGEEAFPDAQVEALIALLRDLCARHRIDPRQVLGHSDLAPRRKVDPGPLFPWKRLADAGFGLWPRGTPADPPLGFDGWAALRAIGYSLDDPRATLHSFRLRFRGFDDGGLTAAPQAPPPAFDPEDLRILSALVAQLDG